VAVRPVHLMSELPKPFPEPLGFEKVSSFKGAQSWEGKSTCFRESERSNYETSPTIFLSS